MNGRNNKSRLFVNLLVMWMVLCSSNSLITQNIFSIKSVNIITTIIVCAVFFIKKRKKVIKNNCLKIAISLAFLILITVLFNLDFGNIGGYLLIVLQILQMFFLVNSFDSDDIQSAYVNALGHIAVVSIIVTYLMPLGEFEKNLPSIVNINNLKFYWFFFAAKLDAGGSFGIRNYGIFSEPAAFCLYLFIAMYFTLNLEIGWKKKTFLILLFSFVSFSTMSPIGMILGIVFASVISVDVYKKSSASDKTLLTILLGVVIALISSITVFNESYYYVIQKTNIDYGSGLGRFQSIMNNLKLWINRPFFGNGLNSTTDLTFALGSNTTTSGVMLSCFGIVFSLIVTVSQFNNFWQNQKWNTITKILVIVMFYAVVNNYGFIQTEWYWFFCFGLYNANSLLYKETNKSVIKRNI